MIPCRDRIADTIPTRVDGILGMDRMVELRLTSAFEANGSVIPDEILSECEALVERARTVSPTNFEPLQVGFVKRSRHRSFTCLFIQLFWGRGRRKRKKERKKQ